jgi:ADP-ribosylglycohydrolase
MIGAIIGDIIGSIYEHRKVGTKDFPLFHPLSTWTDDTVLSLAVAEAVLTGKSYDTTIREFALRYPHAGYGGSFIQWMNDDSAGSYNSWGNGSAMRVGAIGYAFNTEEEVLKEAAASAAVTHNHPEGIKGAQAIALSIFLARKSLSKDKIRKKISEQFSYNMNRTIEEIRPAYHFDVSCEGSVPEAIIAFLDSDSFESAIRNAVYLDGDSDTIAAMAGAIAEAWYGGVPEKIRAKAMSILPPDLLDVVTRFIQMYIPPANLEDKGLVNGWFETRLESMNYVVADSETFSGTLDPEQLKKELLEINNHNQNADDDSDIDGVLEELD